MFKNDDDTVIKLSTVDSEYIVRKKKKITIEKEVDQPSKQLFTTTKRSSSKDRAYNSDRIKTVTWGFAQVNSWED